VTIAAKPRPLRDLSARDWTFSFGPYQIPAK
jgi:hypothetical protein